jgi:hypothetical protein
MYGGNEICIKHSKGRGHLTELGVEGGMCETQDMKVRQNSTCLGQVIKPKDIRLAGHVAVTG